MKKRAINKTDEENHEAIAEGNQKLCRQIVEEIAHGGASQSVAVRVLKALKEHLGAFLPSELIDAIPDTVYMLKKVAGLESIRSFRRHFCPQGCRMFSGESGDQEKCGICPNGWRYDDFNKPMSENIYFPLDDWVERMYSMDVVARFLDNWADKAKGRHQAGPFIYIYINAYVCV